MSTRVCTGLVRFSYVSVFEPKQNKGGGKPKYQTTLLIPKSDTKTLEKIRTAQKEAAQKFREKNGMKSLPADPQTTLWDGDGKTKNGDEFGEECRGHMVISVSSVDKPKVLDANKNPISDYRDFYSGCYGQAVIDFYAFAKDGNKGVTASLMGVRKIKDGEPLSGGHCSDSDFDDECVADELGGDDDWMS